MMTPAAVSVQKEPPPCGSAGAEEEEDVKEEERTYQILALYKFVSPQFSSRQLEALREELEAQCRQHQARGLLLLAPEGVNGTICYPESHHGLLSFFQERFQGLQYRLSYHDKYVFTRLNVKIKKEIVTLSSSSSSCDCDPTVAVGEYVPPGPEWNALLMDPDCWVIDARNEYEIRVGTFRNAINPHTRSFREFPAWLRKQQQEEARRPPSKIAMYCTGGIRCEKSTSLVLTSQLFPNTPIYHLKGGILGYLEEVNPRESLFDGECFVFDQRVAVGHGLDPTTTYTSCYGCRNPLSAEDRERDDYVPGVSCRYCTEELTEKQRARYRERQLQIDLAAMQGRPHMHDAKQEPYETTRH